MSYLEFLLMSSPKPPLTPFGNDIRPVGRSRRVYVQFPQMHNTSTEACAPHQVTSRASLGNYTVELSQIWPLHPGRNMYGRATVHPWSSLSNGIYRRRSRVSTERHLISTPRIPTRGICPGWCDGRILFPILVPGGRIRGDECTELYLCFCFFLVFSYVQVFLPSRLFLALN